MTYELPVTNEKLSHRLLPQWFIVAFFIGIIMISALLFPIKTLQIEALKVSQPQIIANYYLQQLVKLYPDQTALRIALVQQQIGLHHWAAAENQISILESDADMQIETQLLRFQLAYTQAYQMPAGTLHDTKFAALRMELESFKKLPLQPDQLLSLANIGLNLGMPGLALSYYQRLGPITDSELLKQIAQTALQTSQYAICAQYYMLAAQHETTLEQKRSDIIAALSALVAGKLFEQGIQLIAKLPDNIIDNKAMLTYLVQYMLAANRPDLAQVYIKRALLE